MVYDLNSTRKEIAWNGIAFTVPSQWEVGQIGIRHLIFEDDDGPAMEIKWGPVKGRFSHRAHLKRLKAQQPKKLNKSLIEWTPPRNWDKALRGFEKGGFAWETRNTSSRGVILYCPVCRKASLIQTFHQNRETAKQNLLKVIKSLRDHREDGMTAWSLFDIRAMLPEKFQLTRHRFEAGKFENEFIFRRQKLTLYRWGLASILLSKQSLVEFAKTLPQVSNGHPDPVFKRSGDAVEWQATPKNQWQRSISRLKPNPSFKWLRLWHLEDKNRILGVCAEDRRPLDPDMLNRICSQYESI